jgi:hypothetical protein
MERQDQDQQQDKLQPQDQKQDQMAQERDKRKPEEKKDMENPVGNVPDPQGEDQERKPGNA